MNSKRAPLALGDVGDFAEKRVRASAPAAAAPRNEGSAEPGRGRHRVARAAPTSASAFIHGRDVGGPADAPPPFGTALRTRARVRRRACVPAAHGRAPRPLPPPTSICSNHFLGFEAVSVGRPSDDVLMWIKAGARQAWPGSPRAQPGSTAMERWKGKVAVAAGAMFRIGCAAVALGPVLGLIRRLQRRTRAATSSKPRLSTV